MSKNRGNEKCGKWEASPEKKRNCRIFSCVCVFKPLLCSTNSWCKCKWMTLNSACWIHQQPYKKKQNSGAGVVGNCTTWHTDNNEIKGAWGETWSFAFFLYTIFTRGLPQSQRKIWRFLVVNSAPWHEIAVVAWLAGIPFKVHFRGRGMLGIL